MPAKRKKCVQIHSNQQTTPKRTKRGYGLPDIVPMFVQLFIQLLGYGGHKRCACVCKNMIPLSYAVTCKLRKECNSTLWFHNSSLLQQLYPHQFYRDYQQRQALRKIRDDRMKALSQNERNILNAHSRELKALWLRLLADHLNEPPFSTLETLDRFYWGSIYERLDLTSIVYKLDDFPIDTSVEKSILHVFQKDLLHYELSEKHWVVTHVQEHSALETIIYCCQETYHPNGADMFVRLMQLFSIHYGVCGLLCLIKFYRTIHTDKSEPVKLPEKLYLEGLCLGMESLDLIKERCHLTMTHCSCAKFRLDE